MNSETITPGTIVESQHGGREHRGVVLNDPHPLAGWIWVEWEHIGRWDEYANDVTVIEVKP